MTWTWAGYLASGLVIAVVSVAMDLSPEQGLIALAGGFIFLSFAERMLKRRANGRKRHRDAEPLKTASTLELNLLHAYREPRD